MLTFHIFLSTHKVTGYILNKNITYNNMDLYILYQERFIKMEIIIATTNQLFGLIHKDKTSILK